MKKILTGILLLLIASYCYATPPSRVNTYVSGNTILSNDVTQNEDSIFNYLQGGVDTIKDGVIVNADISSGANIQSDKVNLTSVSQNIANTGTLANTGDVTITGNISVSGTNDIIPSGVIVMRSGS